MRPEVPLEQANAARDRARRLRAEALMSVSCERMTVVELLEEARHERALGKVRIRQLLLAQPGWGNTRVSTALRRMARTVGVDLTTPKLGQLNLDWLLDPRAGGRRLMAFADAVAERVECPWEGFPYTPAPAGLREVAAAWSH